jgi:hypothetical protein
MLKWTVGKTFKAPGWQRQTRSLPRPFFPRSHSRTVVTSLTLTLNRSLALKRFTTVSDLFSLAYTLLTSTVPLDLGFHSHSRSLISWPALGARMLSSDSRHVVRILLKIHAESFFVGRDFASKYEGA